MPETKIRISPELYEKIKAIAEKSGKSIRELAEEALNAYILGREGIEGKDIKGITDKIIPLQYPAKCRRCKKQLNEGDLAYWVKITYNDNTIKSYVLCLDCYYQSNALKEWYLKKKQLERIVKALRKEADELSEQVLELRKYRDVIQIKEQARELLREVQELIDVFMGADDVRSELSKLQQAVENIYEASQRLISIIQSIEEQEQAKVKVKQRRRESRRWEY